MGKAARQCPEPGPTDGRNGSRQLKAEEAEIIRRANEQAQRVLAETLRQSRALYEEQQQRIAEKQSAERVWQESQKKLKSWQQQLEEETPEPVFEGKAPASVKPGDYVYLPKLDKFGSVLDTPGWRRPSDGAGGCDQDQS